MLWQEAHRKVVPHESYRPIKLALLKRIDPQFARFLDGDLSLRENLKIRQGSHLGAASGWTEYRLSTIPSGSRRVRRTISNPTTWFWRVDRRRCRAYLRIMGWHEMFNG